MFVIVVSGHFIFPLYVGLWRSSPHVKHRSKNDMLIDFIEDLDQKVATKDKTLSEIEITFDSA